MMKKISIVVLAIGVFVALSAEGIHSQTLPPILNIGTHPVGAFQNVVGAAAAIVVGKHTPMKATVRPMAGPAAWMPLVATGEVDLGITTNWDAEKGYLGESVYGKLSKGKGFPIRLIAISVCNCGSLIV